LFLKAIYNAFFLCGLGDALTTGFGLLLGFSETRVLFVPFLATLIFWGALWITESLPSPNIVRVVIQYFLFAVAFSPVASNLMVLLGVHSLTLLG
jgi:hypothetical protein